MGVIIRDVGLEDLETLSVIYADAFRPEKTNEHWTPTLAKQVMNYWHKRSPEGMQILAEQEGKVLGAIFMDIKPWWDGPRMIDGEFFVSSEAQGMGVGRILLKTILQKAKDGYNITCFETITFKPETEHPLKWYKRLGFEIDEVLVVISGKTDTILENLK